MRVFGLLWLRTVVIRFMAVAATYGYIKQPMKGLYVSFTISRPLR